MAVSGVTLNAVGNRAMQRQLGVSETTPIQGWWWSKKKYEPSGSDAYTGEEQVQATAVAKDIVDPLKGLMSSLESASEYSGQSLVKAARSVAKKLKWVDPTGASEVAANVLFFTNLALSLRALKGNWANMTTYQPLLFETNLSQISADLEQLKKQISTPKEPEADDAPLLPDGGLAGDEITSINEGLAALKDVIYSE